MGILLFGDQGTDRGERRSWGGEKKTFLRTERRRGPLVRSARKAEKTVRRGEVGEKRGPLLLGLTLRSSKDGEIAAGF